MLFSPDGHLITGRYTSLSNSLLGSMVLHENTQVNAFYVFGQCNAKNF